MKNSLKNTMENTLNRVSQTLFRLMCLSTLCLVASCGGESKKTPTSASTGPSGKQFSNELQYYDGRPSLSSDGLRLAFESGRGGVTTRVFKATIPADPSVADAAPAAPVRLTTTDDLASENSPVISPDGNHVAFIGTDSDKNREAWSASWTDGSATMLSADGEQVFAVDFSPDSLLVAYGAFTAAGTTIVEVVDRTTPQTRARLTTEGRAITSLRWLQSGAGYRLATAGSVEVSGVSVTKIETWSFNAVAGVAASSPAVLTTKSVIAATGNLPAWISQDATKILTVQALQPSATRSVPETGTGALADRKIFARSELLFLDPATSAETVADSPQGDAVLSVSSSQSLTLVTVNETSRCQEGGLPSRATIMKLSATPQTAASFERLVVRKTSTGKTFDVVASQCDDSLTGEGVALDLAAGQAIINGAAASSDLTIAHISVTTGDPEVLVIRRAQGTTKVWDVSANGL